MWIVLTVVAFAVVAFCVWLAKSVEAAGGVLLFPFMLLCGYSGAGGVSLGEAAKCVALAVLIALFVLWYECLGLKEQLLEADRKVEELEKLVPPRLRAPRKKGWDGGQD